MSMTTTGLERMRQRVLKRAALLDSDAMKATLQGMAEDMALQMFRQAASFTPGGAKDLSPAYRKEKQKRYGHAYPILHATGQLLRSMYAVAFRKGPAHWALRLGWRGQRGKISNAELAVIHIEGRGNVPARDFTKFPKGWAKPWLTRINRLLQTAR